MNYANDHIRNVLVAGHGGAGKTSLVEAMLYLTKATDRQGRVEDGNTVCDFDPEEIKRHVSLSMRPQCGFCFQVKPWRRQKVVRQYGLSR